MAFYRDPSICCDGLVDAEYLQTNDIHYDLLFDERRRNCQVHKKTFFFRSGGKKGEIRSNYVRCCTIYRDEIVPPIAPRFLKKS